MERSWGGGMEWLFLKKGMAGVSSDTRQHKAFAIVLLIRNRKSRSHKHKVPYKFRSKALLMKGRPAETDLHLLVGTLNRSTVCGSSLLLLAALSVLIEMLILNKINKSAHWIIVN